MVVYTMTKKQILRIISAVLFGLLVAAIIIFAVFNAVTASADERKLPIYCVDRGDNKIALTFDCAWGNSNTDELLSILKNANAKATFFVTGEFCDKYPEDVKKFHDAGHSVQNHSDVHPHVNGMNINSLIEDTRECSRKIKMITGEEPVLYRSPYGEYDDNVITTVEGMGLKVIQWSVDSIDWEDPDPYTIYERITSKTESGSILLFHNDLENTTEALPEILTELLQSGFEFAAVEDMIYYEDYYIDNAGKQIYEPKTSAVTHIVLYADDPYANSAFEKMRLNLTLEEIYNLSVYGELKLDVLEKNKTYLTKAEIAALYEMSYEELYAAYIALVYAAETYGAAGGETTGTTTAATTPVPEETTTVTTVPDKTEIIYDKTDVTTAGDKTETALTSADKSDVTTSAQITGMGDKTDIVITTVYPDKTETTTTAIPPVETTPDTTVITSTTTTAPPATTFEGTVDGDVIIVTTEPK
ncbi:MAG: polysaccharide deacetylase family protein [Ruminiclostridium sp.]|nr:polysaccharide deacetylase family protein [Ruminiclostridium sp.]